LVNAKITQGVDLFSDSSQTGAAFPFSLLPAFASDVRD
jgi:hypothetical protein